LDTNQHVREATDHDLESIVSLLNELTEFAACGFEIDTQHAREILSFMARNTGQYKNFVAVANGRVAGFLSMVYYKNLFHKNGTALINELVVTKEMRGQGIGRELIEKAVRQSIADGLDEIEVGTEKGNLNATAFYKRAGFDEEYMLLGRELRP
jgi:ribosomal protein S18 acetylase RimI-like enzyme